MKIVFGNDSDDEQMIVDIISGISTYTGFTCKFTITSLSEQQERTKKEYYIGTDDVFNLGKALISSVKGYLIGQKNKPNIFF